MVSAKRMAACVLGLTLTTLGARAQSSPSAWEPPQSLWVGAEFASFKAGFPKDSTVRMEGVGITARYNWNHRYALDGQVRFLNLNSWYGETEQNYLAGPRYTFLNSNRWRPFARFEVGAVHIKYPFQMGTGTSFAMAPGGGVEYRFDRRWSAQATYEYQLLTTSPNFTDEPHFGIRPNGATVGISYRLF